MHGLGNDFVVIDAVKQPFSLSASQIRMMANRRLGVGFDQMLVLEPPRRSGVDFHFRIFNADGGEVGQCGNGARCLALFIRHQHLSASPEIIVSTLEGQLRLTIESDDKVTVAMGVPTFSPGEVPFLTDTLSNFYEMTVGETSVTFSVVNVGNPHAIIKVPELNTEEINWLGPLLSSHVSFPQATNVGFMQIIDPMRIRMRAYERGVGETLACGSGACAAVAVGRRNGWLQERVTVNQPGGSLVVNWQGPDTVIRLTGPGATVFSGVWEGF